MSRYVFITGAQRDTIANLVDEADADHERVVKKWADDVQSYERLMESKARKEEETGKPQPNGPWANKSRPHYPIEKLKGITKRRERLQALVDEYDAQGPGE
jgi:hypothetical protein